MSEQRAVIERIRKSLEERPALTVEDRDLDACALCRLPFGGPLERFTLTDLAEHGYEFTLCGACVSAFPTEGSRLFCLAMARYFCAYMTVFQ